MNNDYDWTIECLCGNNFSAAAARNWRGAGGKYINRSIERASTDNRIEVQCPKCLLWIDATSNDLNDCK